jgi:acyl carrier protein
MESEIFQIIKDETGAEEFNLDTPMEKLVEDSLEFLSLITTIKDKFGEFPDAWIAHIKTVRDLVELVNGVISRRNVPAVL